MDTKAIGIIRGKKYVDDIIKKYGNVPISQIGLAVSDSATPRTLLVRLMMERSGVTIKKLADYLNISEQALRNKIVRDSFSFDDMIICAYACNCVFQIKDLSSDDEVYSITPEDYFKYRDSQKISKDERILPKIKKLKDDSRKEKLAEIERLKAKLEKLQSEL